MADAAAASAQMPVKDGSRVAGDAEGRRQPQGSPKRRQYSWEELQGITARAATAIDRVEYLASSQVKFMDFKISEAEKQGLILRHSSQPTMKLDQSLGKSKSNASSIFDEQSHTLKQFQTSTKRLDAFNKYIVDQESKGGKQIGDKAKSVLKGSRPAPLAYPGYKDLFHSRLREEGARRLTPGMAVSVPLPYQMPEEALRHGTPKRRHNKTF
mmetsp:Transcript_111959/g.321695  ORF Transcript_111959/g.321695 Transcript_111959/m.321695 type:complete len:212 (-) Transcript_111959:206-841(-)